MSVDHSDALTHLKCSLVQFVVLLKHLSATQIKKLSQFERCEENILSDANLVGWIENCTSSDLEILIRYAQTPPQDIPAQNGTITSNQIIRFGCIFRLLLLQEMLHQYLSVEHLAALPSIIPTFSLDQQLKFAQQFQSLLNQIMPDTLSNLYEQLMETNDSARTELLFELLQPEKDDILVFESLSNLFRLPLDVMLHFQQAFVLLQPIQLVQLVRLLQLDPLSVLEIRQLLSPDLTGNLGLQTLFVKPTRDEDADDMDDCEMKDGEMKDGDEECFEYDEADSDCSPHPQCPVAIKIIEQPPEVTVYRRNLKPVPTVIITGEERACLTSNESLQVRAVLYRCDTLMEITEHLTGNSVLKASVGSAIKFKKLKINVTSRQLNDTLLCVRFEVHKVRTDSNGNNGQTTELLTSVQSNPMLLVSHSSIIKKASQALPVITEIVPSTGLCTGGTRVAILGSRFVDSPSVRIRFDDIEVMPEFHGGNTLICTTPQHLPGPVSVVVSNDSKLWSETSAYFTYEQSQDLDAILSATSVNTHLGGTYMDLCSSVFDMCHPSAFSDLLSQSPSTPFDLNVCDNRGYALLHTAAALGRVDCGIQLLQRGANVNVRDKNGNTPLYWAAYNSHVQFVYLLLRAGCDVQSQNNEGNNLLHLIHDMPAPPAGLAQFLMSLGVSTNCEALEGHSPLHTATAASDLSFIDLLLQHGAEAQHVDHYGDSVLHWAVREHDTLLCEQLLARGVNPNLQNEDNETALHLAVLLQFDDVVEVLLRSNKCSQEVVHSVARCVTKKNSNSEKQHTISLLSMDSVFFSTFASLQLKDAQQSITLHCNLDHSHTHSGVLSSLCVS